MSNQPDEQPWLPYEHSAPWSLDRYRHAIFTPNFAKKHFVLPYLNRVGLSIPEFILSSVIAASTITLAIFQRTIPPTESGNTAQILFIPLFLFVMYRSFMSWLFGISFERAMFWHAFLSFIATGFSIWHGVVAMYWAPTESEHQNDSGRPLGLASFTTGPLQSYFITGTLATLFFILLFLTSSHVLRAAFPRIWLWSHHILLIPAIIFSVIHGAPAVLAGLAFYFVDRVFVYAIQPFWLYKHVPSQASAVALTDNLVRISMPRSFQFAPGQFLGLYIPTVSRFEFHNFSIASAPSDPDLTLLIRADGRWTKKLHHIVTQTTPQIHHASDTHSNSDQSSANEIQVVPLPLRIHGPVGKIALDWQSSTYTAFVLVAGGIGITPLLSFYQHLAYQASRNRPFHFVRLVWASQSPQLFTHVCHSALLSRYGLKCVQSGNSQRVPAEALEDGHSDRCIPSFSCDLYVTRGNHPTEGQHASRDGLLSVEKSVFGNVHWFEGRPNLPAILADAGRTAANGNVHRVAVLACGPSSLTMQLCNACMKASNSNLRFDVHLEQFQ